MNRLSPQWLRKRSRKPLVERLEQRCLLSASALIEAEPNDTLNLAQSLGDLSTSVQVELLGNIGDGANGAADVDWSTFTLDKAAHLNLSATGDNLPVLSLYNSQAGYGADPFTPFGNRLVEQQTGSIVRDLAPGTYYLAVSGEGNNYFNPFLAGSGYPGLTGNYDLTANATDIVQSPQDGPSVLTSDPAANDNLTSSPFVIRVDFSKAIDPSTVNTDSNVRLIYSATGNFGDGTDVPVSLSSYNYSPEAVELQIVPAAPLVPGYYQLFLGGDTNQGQLAIVDPNGIPFGASAANPLGQDYTSTFQISGIQGQTAPTAGADDTAPNATDLGTLDSGLLVQATGAIGNDPYYDTTNPNVTVNPSSDVNMYHFAITGAGTYAFSAEVFAGRIGSPLDPGVSLFRLDPATGKLVFIDGNNDTRNAALATNGTLPLNADSALFDGLTAGDYYLAVSTNYNTPTPVASSEPGSNGIFDPNITHSGTAGFSTGPYVLNLMVQADSISPKVVSTSIAEGAMLAAAPTSLDVTFGEAMNVRQLFATAFDQHAQNTIAAVFIQDDAGTKFFPRLLSYDDSANTASFSMLDGLANGNYTLHLSSSNGLTDLAGLPLTSNDASGDYVIHFCVHGPSRGTNGDPLKWSAQEPNDTVGTAQNIGVLFPHELQTGVVINRDFTADPTTAPADTADFYTIQVLQSQTYGINLSGANLPAGVQVSMTDATGNLVPFRTADGRHLIAPLNPGTYTISVSGWTPDLAPTVAYFLQIQLVGNSDNAPALTTGPAPALRPQLADSSLKGASIINPSAPTTIDSSLNGNSSSVVPSFPPNDLLISTPTVPTANSPSVIPSIIPSIVVAPTANASPTPATVSTAAPVSTGTSSGVPKAVSDQLGLTLLGSASGHEAASARSAPERLALVRPDSSNPAPATAGGGQAFYTSTTNHSNIVRTGSPDLAFGGAAEEEAEPNYAGIFKNVDEWMHKFKLAEKPLEAPATVRVIPEKAREAEGDGDEVLPFEFLAEKPDRVSTAKSVSDNRSAAEKLLFRSPEVAPGGIHSQSDWQVKRSEPIAVTSSPSAGESGDPSAVSQVVAGLAALAGAGYAARWGWMKKSSASRGRSAVSPIAGGGDNGKREIRQ